MSYTDLILAQYEFARTAHNLGHILLSVKSDKGSVTINSGYATAMMEFSEATSRLYKLKGGTESLK